MGASDNVRNQYQASIERDVFEVWPENWDTVQLFLIVQRQWRTGPMGGVLGLDYASVYAAINMAGITIKPETFDGLRIMESAIIEVMNKNT